MDQRLLLTLREIKAAKHDNNNNNNAKRERSRQGADETPRLRLAGGHAHL